MKALAIHWRDEAYGQHSCAQAAFRLYDTFMLSDTAVRRIHGKARKAGFTFCYSRCAWIALEVSAAHAFVAGVQALGYSVSHEGCWQALPPDTGRQTSPPS